jgi:hypothetical protein
VFAALAGDTSRATRLASCWHSPEWRSAGAASTPLTAGATAGASIVVVTGVAAGDAGAADAAVVPKASTSSATPVRNCSSRCPSQ